MTTWADFDCTDDEYRVVGSFGVNPTATDLPPIIGLPGAPSGTLAQVQIQWLAQESRERQNELITIDYKAGTTSNVDVFDGSVGAITQADLRDAEIDPITNFPHGQLDVNWCMPVGRSDGLIFAIYEFGGNPVGLQGSPFAVFDGASTTAVLNQAITNQMGLEFNESGAEETQEDIEAVTGVYPPRYLAEHIFQRDIPATLTDELKNEALFHNPTDGVVVGNMFIVTGSNAGAYTPSSVDRALRDGTEHLSPSKFVADLDNLMGEWSMVIEWGYYRPVFVVEGRADLQAEATPCTNNFSTITADFMYPSTLQSVIELWNGDYLDQFVTGSAMEVLVQCGANFEVRGYRSIRDQQVDSDVESFNFSP